MVRERDWSAEECFLAVWAYDRMDRDRDLTKADLYREVASSTGRSAKSVEYRVQNVSGCDPRPWEEKPISSRLNVQGTLRRVFTEYWTNRDVGAALYPAVVEDIRTDTRSTRLAGVPLPWIEAFDRIHRAQQHEVYMPLAVLSAVREIETGIATPETLPFRPVATRFDSLADEYDLDVKGMAYLPFFHLAGRARIWTLLKDWEAVPYSRDIRPKREADLLRIANAARFDPVLASGLSDEASRAAIGLRLLGLMGGQVKGGIADPVLFAAAERELLADPGLMKPPGQKTPARDVRQAATYRRDAAVSAFVRQRAKGTCESCLLSAPFQRRSDGQPFLEVHHLHHLADGGPDVVENAIAICPNCHRELHYGIGVPERVTAIRTRLGLA